VRTKVRRPSPSPSPGRRTLPSAARRRRQVPPFPGRKTPTPIARGGPRLHHRPAAAGDLQQDDAEAVDVGVGVGPAGDHSLGVHVPHRPREHGRVRGPAVVEQPGEPEVAELGVEGRVQHHVAGLDVPVHHALLPLLVQVEQRGGQVEHDLAPARPRQQRAAVEVRVETAVGHELVDEQQLAAAVAPADDLHQVAVPEPADDAHLRGVLLPPLPRSLAHPLDGRVEARLLEEPPVH
jgi:hypothetical protein